MIIPLTIAREIPGDILERWDEAELVSWLFRWLFDQMEHHEAQEWFKVDGKQVWNPHGRQTG